MTKAAMISNRILPYIDGRSVAAEEPFDVDEKFVEVLTLSGAARRANSDKAASEAPKRRQYRRRDMTAEDRTS